MLSVNSLNPFSDTVPLTLRDQLLAAAKNIIRFRIYMELFKPRDPVAT